MQKEINGSGNQSSTEKEMPRMCGFCENFSDAMAGERRCNNSQTSSLPFAAYVPELIIIFRRKN